jgi:hypothetical protein
MIGNLQRIFGVLSVLMLAGCASATIDPAATSGAKTIGVAYAMPDQVDFAKVGITVFGNSRSKGDAAPWHLDEVFLESAKAALQDHYNVVTAHVDPEAYAQLKDAAGFMTGHPSAERTKAAIGAGLPHADLWVVLGPSCMSLPNATAGIFPCGIGIYRPEQLMLSVRPAAGIWGDMALYDGNSFAYLGTAPLAITTVDCPVDQDGIAKNALNGIGLLVLRSLKTPQPRLCAPSEALDDRWMVGSWGELDVEQHDAAAQTFRKLMAEGVAPTLRQMHLAQ